MMKKERWMSRHTLQLQKDSQPRFVIGRNLAHMRGENRLDVFFQSAGFEEGTERIADGVDLVGRDRDSRGCVFARLFTIHSLGGVLRAIYYMLAATNQSGPFGKQDVRERRDE